MTMAMRLPAKPTSRSGTGRRLRRADSRSMIIDGPFAETKEIVAGYWKFLACPDCAGQGRHRARK
jgi:hypothetical protein